MDLATAFFVEEVDPTVREFVAEFGSVRRARLATISLVHLADHVWHHRPGDREGTESENAFRDLLARRDEAFRILADVANASKHAVLWPRSSKQLPATIQGADDLKAAVFNWGEGDWDEMRADSAPQVIVYCQDGTARAVDRLAMRVHAMWAARLNVTLPPLE